ncbi:hypothetical protein BH10PSE12_BH10PSE12_06050 [soil metagenome]
MNPANRLEAIEDIRQLKARYFRLGDSKDWDAWAQLFTVDALFDASETNIVGDMPTSATELPDSPLNEPIRGIDAILAACKAFVPPSSVSVHHGYMPEIEIVSDDEARGTWAMSDRISWPDGAPGSSPDRVLVEMTGHGHYFETYRRVDGAWRIARMKITRQRLDLTYR